MIDIIFNSQNRLNTNANRLLSINNDYHFKGSNCAFGPLSKTNIFIGENNSGKSRFLRCLFGGKYYTIDNEQFDRFFAEIKSTVYYFYEKVSSNKLEIFNTLYERIGREPSRYANAGNTFFSNLDVHSNQCRDIDRFYFPIIRGIKDYQTIINDKLNLFAKSETSIQNKDSINHYISLLNLDAKGLESFDVYNEIITHEYFKDKKSLSDNILTGGKLYNEIKSMLLGDESQRKTIEDFQKFLRNTFFSEEYTVQLIPNEKKKVLFVKIGKDERAIYNWGDGTQQLIVILFALFKYRDIQNKLFFIEEPELYLHPGVLRKFIEVINSDIFKNHQYFITTHSNIVLDTSADTSMSIFKFKKVKDISKNEGKSFLIEQCNNGDVSLLNELGVRNSSVFLSNCSIWVEGITDRLYLKHYLKLYIEHLNKKNAQNKKEFRENVDYTFIEYGGSNLVHFNFSEEDVSDSINAKYISNRIFLIADNDNTSAEKLKAKRKEELRKILKEKFYELSVKEVENLITSDTLRKVLLSQNSYKENEINKVFESEKNFENVSLGEFIDSLFPNGEIRKYAAESGTIKNKLQFCKTVIEVTNDFNELSKEARILTEKIYAFIKENNEI